MPETKEISIVVPVFNEAGNIEALYKELITVLQSLNMSYEIIMVDDGSQDKSFDKIRELNAVNKALSGISLSRNFGHQVALLAGMQQAFGNVVITMDADLQHPPEVIPLLYEKYKEGFDIVNTIRADSNETGFFKKNSSKFFYRLINNLSDAKIIESSSDFRLMSRKAINSFLQFRERNRFTRGLVSWMGFQQTVVHYNCSPRFSGKSKYTLRKMIHFALDGITSFSAKPLRIASYIGFLVFFAGMIYAAYAIIKHFNGVTMPGWTSILVTVLIIGGIQLLTIGIIGEYLARIFNESKSRPIYFIKDQTN